LTPEAERWVAEHVHPAGPAELARKRPWSTVYRVPAAGGAAWFKACNEVQAFEPRLSAELFRRWPDLVGEVLAYDEARGWLLLADAGERTSAAGEPWLELLPRYAELQRGEARHAEEHLAYGVPDLTLEALPARYAELLERELPVELRPVEEIERLCAELAAAGLPATIQHDDLHRNNVYRRDGHVRLLDWGDSSVSHPFFSLVVTFRFTGESPQLRDAYLEPWGPGLDEVLELALRVGAVAHALAWSRQRDFLSPAERRAFDVPFAEVLHGALG
jgi:phosphotransferase family enzyme